MAEVQDLVVVGGGAGGFAAAMRAAQLGGNVTVVESGHYGGDCMNKACIPLTLLMTAAQMVRCVQKAGRFGLGLPEPELNLAALHDRKDLLVEGLRMGTEQLLAEVGITLVEGRGRLAAAGIVEVGETRIEARNVILATGSVQAQLPIAGADLPGVIGTEEAIELRDVPPRLAVIGSQAWDVELGQYFRLMGSDVTYICSGDQVLAEADGDVAQRLAKALHDGGIAIKRRVAVEAIRQGEDGALVVHLAGGQEPVVADRVLASRRLSNSAGLGLRELGIAMEGAAVLVDDRMATSVPHVYAIGDVTRGPFWSHKANAEGIVAAENAMGGNSRMRYDILPYCAYTLPQVAWVGLTEEQAEARGLACEIGKVPVALNPYAMILDETAGEIKVIACKKYGKIVGAHLVAPGAIDLINTIAVAMLSEATVGELMRFIPRHPSLGEALVDAAMDVEKRSLHMPR
ncbi:MAG: FAD-dependent oxidoreductase [Anaerolineae bacterium]|jgi:dihydrolipoamide dehydrogenase|nr:FAD-dependent oxidoreductase [Anaerolineae bacterium]